MHPHRSRETFGVTHRDVDGVAPVLGCRHFTDRRTGPAHRASLLGGAELQVDVHALPDEYLVPVRPQREAGTDAYGPGAGIDRLDCTTADDTPAMQIAVVPSNFLAKVVLLVAHIERRQHLARKVTHAFQGSFTACTRQVGHIRHGNSPRTRGQPTVKVMMKSPPGSPLPEIRPCAGIAGSPSSALPARSARPSRLAEASSVPQRNIR